MSVDPDKPLVAVISRLVPQVRRYRGGTAAAVVPHRAVLREDVSSEQPSQSPVHANALLHTVSLNSTVCVCVDLVPPLPPCPLPLPLPCPAAEGHPSD